MAWGFGVKTHSKMNPYLFRCSSLGKIMTAVEKPIDKAATTRAHLVECFIQHKYGRTNDIANKYLEKGTIVEEDSMTLLAKADGRFYRKNQQHFKNDYIAGTPDIVTGELVIDLKSSWDIFTFWKAKTSPVDSDYYWQLQGYMALTFTQRARLVYCLVDTPAHLVEQSKRQLMYKMGVTDTDHPAFVACCEEIDRLSTYEDIPLSERIHSIEIERNNEDIVRLYSRIEDCRKWMDENLYNIKTQIDQ